MSPGCIDQIANVVASYACQDLLLVTDAGIASTPWPRQVTDQLQAAGLNVHVSDSVEPNPRFTTVDKLAMASRQNNIDGVIGLGGGSVLDAAKAVAMLLNNAGSCLTYKDEVNLIIALLLL